MSLNFSNQTTSSTTKVANNILQTSSESCIFTCGATANNNTAIFIDSNVNYTITARCTIADSSCVAVQTLDSDVSSTLKAMAEQTATAISAPNVSVKGVSFGISASNQSVDLNQYISNSISQINSSTCQF